jgi:uncharacterized RDD family membrane protein YckC
MAGYSRPPERDDTDVIGARIGAQIVDTLIMIFIFYGTLLVMGGMGAVAGETAGSAMALMGFFVGGVAAIGYAFLLEGFWDGQTVGKSLFGIKVVKEDGSECTLGASFLRNLFRIIDGIFYYAVGFIFMASSDKRQRIGDRIAGTVVAREE